MRVTCGVARFDPRSGFGELFGNLAQKLRGALFRFRRDFFLDETLHARELFVNPFTKVFEALDALEPGELFVDALAELLEFVHSG